VFCPFLYRISFADVYIFLAKTSGCFCVIRGTGIARKTQEMSMENQLESLQLLTLPEAADLLQVSIRTLHRMIRKNDLPAFKVGGQWRLRESQLTHWIQCREDLSVVTVKPSTGVR
jgi:excisionase family DNA binding protein